MQFIQKADRKCKCGEAMWYAEEISLLPAVDPRQWIICPLRCWWNCWHHTAPIRLQ